MPYPPRGTWLPRKRGIVMLNTGEFVTLLAMAALFVVVLVVVGRRRR